MTTIAAKTAANSHFWRVRSFARASQEVMTARRSGQLPPYIKPERAMAHSHAAAWGADRRNRRARAGQENVGKSIAAPTIAARNIQARGKMSNTWKMRHHDTPRPERIGPNAWNRKKKISAGTPNNRTVACQFAGLVAIGGCTRRVDPSSAVRREQ